MVVYSRKYHKVNQKFPTDPVEKTKIRSISSELFKLKIRNVFMKKTLALATQKALEIIRTFPLSYNRKPYLRLKDGRKCFFDIFIRKYGLD